MTESKTLWAPIKWAQRKNALYVTVDLCDVKNESVSLTDTSLTFSGTSNDKSYHVQLNFFKPVDSGCKESKWVKTDRNLQFYIIKKDPEEEFWPRLLEDKNLEKTNVHIDWSRYADEDEEDGKENFDMSALGGGGGFDINQMMAAENGNMMDEESDSDDETMPELET